jgi:hypothetical protein
VKAPGGRAQQGQKWAIARLVEMLEARRELRASGARTSGADTAHEARSWSVNRVRRPVCGPAPDN